MIRDGRKVDYENVLVISDLNSNHQYTFTRVIDHGSGTWDCDLSSANHLEAIRGTDRSNGL